MTKSGLASDLGFLPGMFLISLVLRAFPRSAIADYVWAACGIAWILVVFVVGLGDGNRRGLRDSYRRIPAKLT